MNLYREIFFYNKIFFILFGLILLWGIKVVKMEVVERFYLDSNFLKWSVVDVVRFIRFIDCVLLVRIFLD